MKISSGRFTAHPILPPRKERMVQFFWRGVPFYGVPGEPVSSALMAAGVRSFRKHPKTGEPVGLFCANGQCSQCLLLIDGLPLKSCITPLESGMRIEPLEGLPELPQRRESLTSGDFSIFPDRQRQGEIRKGISEEPEEPEVLIIGGGPAGLSAAVELGKAGIQILLVEDKEALGGKLLLQTHKFFGSRETVYAGNRGIEIAEILTRKVKELPSVKIWTDSTASGIFQDKVVGVLRNRERYCLVKPKVLLVAAGAREKSLLFPGNMLPGVYGAGAFQTLINRDRVIPAENIFIIGGGNVGLIVGYHALQAGIRVAGIAEAQGECSGYAVHRDKLLRAGVPLHLSHTLVEAQGKETLERILIARVDKEFSIISGTEKLIPCDTLLIAVGLDPVDEFIGKAKEAGLPVFAAGDCEEIAEASAAIFSGKIAAARILSHLGGAGGSTLPDLEKTMNLLKSKPGKSCSPVPYRSGKRYPVFHCFQEIPCDPCVSLCPRHLIVLQGDDLLGVPQFLKGGEKGECTGCAACVSGCPGLAVTLVDCSKDPENPEVTLAWEFFTESIHKGEIRPVLDKQGREIGTGSITRVKPANRDKTALITVKVNREVADQVAGLAAIPLSQDSQTIDTSVSISSPRKERGPDKVTKSLVSAVCEESGEESSPAAGKGCIICRCEGVTEEEVRALILDGIRDMNQIKALTRSGMGACGGKTCRSLIKNLIKKECPEADYTDFTQRALFLEIPFKVLAGEEGDE